MAKRPEGPCHICGQHAKLSFEHVPPESAFNNRQILRAHIFRKLHGNQETLNDLRQPAGKTQQRGAGDYTLCVKCNSDTGSWYGPAFAEWAKQGMEIAMGTNGPTLIYPFNIHPLRVIKQVVCMFISVNPPSFSQTNPDLIRLVLNKEARHLPGSFRIYAFYTMSDRCRSSGMTGLLKGIDTNNPQTIVLSEITFPPFGFAMTKTSVPPDDRLCDITEFAGFDYRDWCYGIWLRMPIMPIYTFYPGDYRNRDQVHAQAGIH